MAKVKRFVSKDFSFRVALVDLTEIVETMRLSRELSPLVTLGLGRCLLGATLMSSHLKEGQGVGVLIRGDGPLEKLYAEAYYDGAVRAYAANPQYQPESAAIALNLSQAIGQGTLTVARHQPFQKAPFQGTVELVTGEVGEDIAHYLFQSQQIRSVLSLGVYFNEQAQVELAAGILVEVMPGVEDEIIESFERQANQGYPNIKSLFSQPSDDLTKVASFIGRDDVSQIPHDYELKYLCPCSRERVLNALSVWGEEGLKEMIQDRTGEKATCQMCGESYQLSTQDLEMVLAKLQRESSFH